MILSDVESNYDFIPKELLSDDCEIKCPSCKRYSHILDWEEVEEACEICCGHDALLCPKCKNTFGHVYDYTFYIKLP